MHLNTSNYSMTTNTTITQLRLLSTPFLRKIYKNNPGNFLLKVSDFLLIHGKNTLDFITFIS